MAMNDAEDSPPTADDSSERRLARLERRVELLRQSIILITRVVQDLRAMTLPTAAGR
jgi:hypothetical protein